MENLRFFAVNYLKPAAIKITFYSFVLLYSTTTTIRIIYDYFFNNGKSDKYFWKPKSRPIPPKPLTDPSFGTHHYVQLPNVKLHYVEAGSKDRPLMIFIHGFPEFWYSWRHQMEEFSKDHWVVAFDTRGCGDSEKPHGIQYYKLQHLVTDLKNLLDALGRQKCILVAHDWGGVIAWEFLSKYPEMVEKYIIMNAPHPLAFRKHVYSSLKQFKMSWYMLMFQMFWLPEFYLTNRDMKEVENLFLNRRDGRHVYNEEEMEAVKFMWGKPGAFTTSLNYYRANVGMVHRKAEQTVAAQEPPKGFLIFGEDDSYLDARPLVEKSTQLVPTLKTLLVPGACHFVQEDVPDVVNKAMREFLTQ